ncbi:MAG: VCBS repeat-containing protein [Planctomycetota bacterium]|nr:MAG: VCBS repeat-containing protein [Planctomycetota bacterium]
MHITSPTLSALSSCTVRCGASVRIVSWVLCALAAVAMGQAFADEHEEHQGWQSMRVLALSTQPNQMQVVDLGNNDRHTGILLNRRRSEIVALRYVLPEKRRQPGASRRPNDPPMVPEIAMDPLLLRGLPMEMVVATIPGLGPRAVVLTGPSPRLSVVRDDGEGPLVEERVMSLLPGRVLEGVPMQLVEHDEQTFVLIPFQEGTQKVSLSEDAGRAQWLSPRERLAIRGWWWADATGNGTTDLVDWVRRGSGEVALRWRALHDGRLSLPQMVSDLSDFRAESVEVIDNGADGAHIVALPSRGSGELRSYAIARGEEHAYGGRQQVLFSNRGQWTSMELHGSPALVLADGSEPRFLTWRVDEDGFSFGETYPGVAQVRGLVSLGERLFIWRDGAGDLLSSHWQDGRLTFPQPWQPRADVEDRAILALGRVGSVVWWVQRLDKDLQLVRWSDGEDAPVAIDYPQAGERTQRAQWLGGDLLLVQDQFSPNGRLLSLDEEGSPRSLTPPHLARLELSQYRLINVPGAAPRPARIADGVLQWLDDQAQAIDQVMLEEGQGLTDLVMRGDGSALALEQGGNRAHILHPDSAGVLRLQESVDLPGGRSLVTDPHLDLVLEREQSLVRLHAGQPWELQMRHVIDYEGKGENEDEGGIYRIRGIDVTGDGRRELLAFDDAQHRVTVYDPAQDFIPLWSWQVFTDEHYPYGYRRNEIRPQPRLAAAGDLTGDGRNDLIMVAHDRLLIYFAAAEEDLQ